MNRLDSFENKKSVVTGLIYSKFDEFAALMWGIPVALNAGSGQKLEAQFATTSPVEPNKLYGSIQEGTARYWYQPNTNHPGDTWSTEAIGDAVDWFQKTLTGGNGLPPSNQVWYWKEIGNLIALIGFVLFLFAMGGVLLRSRFFATLVEPLPEARPAVGWGWWLAAVLAILIPILTYYPLMTSTWLKLGPLTPQSITNVVLTWALVNALIFVVLFLIWHFLLNRREGATATNYGLTWNGGRLLWDQIGKALLLAVLVVALAYLTLAITGWLCNLDYRIYVFAVKPMSPLQFRIFLTYLIPFFLYFLYFFVNSLILNSQATAG